MIFLLFFTANAGLTVEQRKERDAKIMREKQEKKAAAAAEKAAKK